MARPIGELIPPIMARIHTAMLFQELASRCPTPELRKEFIMVAHCTGVLDREETELLIQANLLETA